MDPRMDPFALRERAHARDVASRQALAVAFEERRCVQAAERALRDIDATSKLVVCRDIVHHGGGILKERVRRYDHRLKRRRSKDTALHGPREETIWGRWAAAIAAVERARGICALPALTPVPVPGEAWEVDDAVLFTAVVAEHRTLARTRLPKALARGRAVTGERLRLARAEHARVRALRAFWALPDEVLASVVVDVTLHLRAFRTPRPTSPTELLDRWDALRSSSKRLEASPHALGLPSASRLRALRDDLVFGDGEDVDGLRHDLHEWAVERGLRDHVPRLGDVLFTSRRRASSRPS